MSHHKHRKNAEHNVADYGVGEKNFSIYLMGIFVCVILTLVPYLAVKYSHYSYVKNVAHIYIAAIAQFIVQVFCFLRLNWSTEQSKMNVLSFLFSLVVVLVIIVGSIWIMSNLHYYMMHS